MNRKNVYLIIIGIALTAPVCWVVESKKKTNTLTISAREAIILTPLIIFPELFGRNRNLATQSPATPALPLALQKISVEGHILSIAGKSVTVDGVSFFVDDKVMTVPVQNGYFTFTPSGTGITFTFYKT